MEGKDIKIIISGLTGKMGKSLESTVKDIRFKELFSNLEIITFGSLSDLQNKDSSVIIDFSEASNTVEVLKEATEQRIPMVIGTTGFNEEQYTIIRDCSNSIPIVLEPNTSIGIATLKSMLSSVKDFNFNDASTKVEIVEKHHKDKKDSPSGTSKDLISYIKEEISEDLNIEIKSIRQDDIAGEHIVSFINQDETLKISHKAHDRSIYSRGALLAAIWLDRNRELLGVYKMPNIYLSLEED